MNDVARVLDPAPVVVVGSSTFIQGFDLSDGQAADGSYVLGASVGDVGGNTATASSVTVSVDFVRPLDDRLRWMGPREIPSEALTMVAPHSTPNLTLTWTGRATRRMGSVHSVLRSPMRPRVRKSVSA